MDIDRLREVQSRERESQSLQPLEDSFYEDAAAFVVEKERERDSLDDPSSQEAQQLNDLVVSARRFAEAVYERRVGKIVNMASLAANGTDVDEGKLTEEERQLFEEVEAAISEHGERVMDVLEGNRGQQELVKERRHSGGRRSGSESEPESAVGEAGSGDGEELGDVEADAEAGGPDTGEGLEGYSTIRVTQDVEEFVGVDGEEYDLEEENVATVPEENARVLCEKGAAEEIDPAS